LAGVIVVLTSRRLSAPRVGTIPVVETIGYRLATRLDALAAAHMLRTRGHAAELPRASVADAGHTLIVRASGDALPRVRAMIEHMFPDAARCPEPLNHKVTDIA
jgi:hypothetical protein